jgi:hypothetical protein
MWPVFPYAIYNSQSDTFHGSDVDVMKIMAEKIGFDISFERHQAPWGKDKASGKWIGVLGDVREVWSFLAIRSI